MCFEGERSKIVHQANLCCLQMQKLNRLQVGNMKFLCSNLIALQNYRNSIVFDHSIPEQELSKHISLRHLLAQELQINLLKCSVEVGLGLSKMTNWHYQLQNKSFQNVTKQIQTNKFLHLMGYLPPHSILFTTHLIQYSVIPLF